MAGDISRHAGKAASPADGRGSFFLVGIFPSWQNFSAVSAAPGEILLVAGIRPNCQTKAVAKAARGLAKAGDKARAPKPAVAQRLFGKILLSSGLADEFTEALWASWSFSLRAQSE